MKVGVNLINFGTGVNPTSLLKWSLLSEELGYHLVMISDHVAITPDVHERYPAPFYDPFTTLAWLAGQTSKLELGTTVMIVPYRNPLLVSKITANLDQLSNGRLILGVGVGWARQEFDALGIPFEKRGEITDEYLKAIKSLWNSDIVSFSGQFSVFQTVHTTPRPKQSPHPPIWVGGSSKAALRRAVLLGDAWHPIRFRMSWLRDYGLPNLKRVADEEKLPMPDLCPRIKVRLTAQSIPENERDAGDGTLDQAKSDLEELQSLGAKYVLIDTYFDDPYIDEDHANSLSILNILAEKVFNLAKNDLR